jgi:hypothetical protein
VVSFTLRLLYLFRKKPVGPRAGPDTMVARKACLPQPGIERRSPSLQAVALLTEPSRLIQSVLRSYFLNKIDWLIDWAMGSDAMNYYDCMQLSAHQRIQLKSQTWRTKNKLTFPLHQLQCFVLELPCQLRLESDVVMHMFYVLLDL